MMCYGHCNFSSPKHHRCGDWHRCYEIAKAGAEFGYNKAKEDADKMKSRFLELCNLKDMRIEKLEKANEWHFTNRNKEHLVIDCPKGEENKLYLLLLNSRDSKEYEFGRKIPVVCYWNEEWCRFERLEHTIGERNVNPMTLMLGKKLYFQRRMNK